MANIAIDTSFTYIARTGMSRYIVSLLEAMRGVSPPDIRIHEIGFRISNESFRQPRRMLLTLTREYLWQPYIAPREMKKVGATVFHSTFSACFGRPHGTKHIATIHDLSPVRTPERYRRWARYRIMLDLQAAAKADHIICVSQSTADDVMQMMGIPAKKISVTYLASSFTADSLEEAPKAVLPSQFFLFVGSLEAGKNLRLLQETYRLAAAKGETLWPLVILGSRIPGPEKEGPSPENWIYLGRQSDAVLAYLYRRARALILPSKNEGFGLPVVEAMTLGCPVIASDLSSLPEVGGAAALYPSSQTAPAYLQSMQSLQNDDSEFANRRTAGFQQSSKFSWKRCAEETLEVYRHVLN